MQNTPHIERQTTPIELSLEARQASLRIFFGGSFDPPHIGHTLLPAQIADQHENAHTIYVPAGRSPFKDTQPTANHHRINMLELATQHTPNTEIWTQELADAPKNPKQPSYWADTWLIAKQMNLPGSNRFLIGADQARSMHRWRRYTEFWKDAMVILRDDADSANTLIKQLAGLNIWKDDDLTHWRSQIVILPTIDVSSTAIRDALTNDSTRDEPITGLDSQVHRYILEHQLYEATE
ncbi:hypothetical protein COB72_10215 [bacterium]|nr:MAG: hypothetical protein COB72_10215 [bacterium]